MNEKTCPNCKIKFEPKTKRQNYCYEQKHINVNFAIKKLRINALKQMGINLFVTKLVIMLIKKHRIKNV